jgi:hypothetical protein
MKLILLFLIIFIQFPAMAEEKLPFSSAFNSIPATSKEGLSNSFSKEALPYWGVILGSTALLYEYDEQLYAEAQKKGKDWRIGNDDNTKPVISLGTQDLLRLPTDTGSALYFLGDGWLHAGIAAGFMGYGSASENTKAYNTGIMLFHGMFVSTIFNQALKRSFGRESPEVSTSKRGSWNLFPSFNEYNSRTGSYDAMPSGHVMTATMTFTVISERYPEYRSFIYPFAGLWITALSFEMMNNGVHWASDYPLAIGMGYVFGKASVAILSKKEKEDKTKDTKTSWMLMPTVNGKVTMLNAVKAF